MSFSSGAEDVRKELLRLSASRCRELFKKIVDDTPIDTGKASGNWQTSTSEPTAVIERLGKEAARSEIDSVISDDYFVRNKQVYFFNNLDYAFGLEYGNPHYTNPAAPFSMQAPSGMVRINIKNFTV